MPAQNVTTEGLPRTEHTYNICSGLKNKPWATFRVFSDPPVGIVQKHQEFPRFSGGDKIAGLIKLTLDNPQTVNLITVSVSPSIRMTYHTDPFISLVGALSEVTLLENLTHALTIKSISRHTPLEIHTFQTTEKFGGKLKGTYQFPFTFPFPTHLDLSTSTTIFLPLQTPSDTVGRPPRSSPQSTPASPSASSSFPSTTSPRISRFCSLSSPKSLKRTRRRLRCAQC